MVENTEKDLTKIQGHNVGVNVGVNKTQQKILEIMYNNNNITQEELALQLGISVRTIERNIVILKEKGIIKRIGSDKAGHWKILK